jgi:hypothetical protein
VILAIFQTGKNWVLKTPILATFRNFFGGPRTGAPGRIFIHEYTTKKMNKSGQKMNTAKKFPKTAILTTF